MVSLKDLLSKQSSQALLSTVKRGDIFRMKLTKAEGITPKNEGDVDRNKYMVILGKTEDGKVFGFVVINSRINVHLSYELKCAHYPIRKDKYSFLDHDSFVYCGDIMEIDIDTFSERYQSQSYGTLDEDDLAYVIGAVKSSATITPKKKKKFGIF